MLVRNLNKSRTLNWAKVVCFGLNPIFSDQPTRTIAATSKLTSRLFNIDNIYLVYGCKRHGIDWICLSNVNGPKITLRLFDTDDRLITSHHVLVCFLCNSPQFLLIMVVFRTIKLWPVSSDSCKGSVCFDARCLCNKERKIK